MLSLSLLLRRTADGIANPEAAVSRLTSSKRLQSLQILEDRSSRTNISNLSIHAWVRQSNDRTHAGESGTVFLEPCRGDGSVGWMRRDDVADVHCFPSFPVGPFVETVAQIWGRFQGWRCGDDPLDRDCWRLFAAVL
ncbi:MAG: hypothetical protein ACF8CQ_05990 [Rhodopirellula sp. JB044]|uniref:hypothetical protein n=1 Tax=Rhodopirellula sp. JB044 TaxID=3342844 RepID=UPI00370B8E82